jgi:hypothetical protein
MECSFSLSSTDNPACANATPHHDRHCLASQRDFVLFAVPSVANSSHSPTASSLHPAALGNSPV